MKKLFSIATILMVVVSCLGISSAQTRRKKRDAVFIGGGAATGARQKQRKIVGGGLGTGARVRRGRYVTRNGKRIWVPQGSPIKKPQSPTAPTRGVYEREEEAELKNNKPTTKPTP